MMKPQNTTSSELTQLKRTFEQITRSMKEYSLILLDKNGNILTWNKAAEKLKGYKEDEIIGQHMSIFFLPEDRQLDLPQELLAEVMQKGQGSFLGRRLRKNGTIFWGRVEMTAITNDEGVVIGFTKLFRELSDETSIGHFWIDNDGVLHTRSSKTPHNPETIEEFRVALKAALNNGKIAVIADIREAILTDAGKSFSQAGVKNIYKAIAMISNAEMDTNTSVVLGMIPEEIPAKVFVSRDLAKQWIKQF